ncbi:MAG: serine protease Do [Thermoleophilaceae bacterium]|jgi:S1-C subfamily serine protease|nr:serine protease Do [Thermoleophilaceae bacterium]
MQLTITSGADAGKTVQVQGNEFTIGREAGADLVLADGKASRRHAALRVLPDGRATLYDLGSSNGTFVNGQRVQSVLLSGGEQIQIGDTVLVPGGGAAAGAGAGQAAGALGATSPGQAVPAVAATSAPPQQATPPPQPQPPAPQAPPTQPLTPGAPPQPAGGFTPPSPTPIARPSRTQSAIQRIMLQRAVNRATIIGVIAIILVIVVGGLAALGVFSGGGSSGEDASAVIPKVTPATTIVVTDIGGGRGGRGTGWVWDAAQGLIVTNAHVVAGGRAFSIAQGSKIDIQQDSTGAFQAGPNARKADLKGAALCEDIAVLKVSDTSGLQTMPQLPAGQDLKLGERVIAVGYPASATASQNPDLDGVLTGDTGDIAQPHTTFPAIPGNEGTTGPYQDVAQTSTVINEGNSGGPLVNFNGQLVGMNTAKNIKNVGQNYAITIQRIRQIVPKLLAGQKLCG